jgi:hypothetical protein
MRAISLWNLKAISRIIFTCNVRPIAETQNASGQYVSDLRKTLLGCGKWRFRRVIRHAFFPVAPPLNGHSEVTYASRRRRARKSSFQ